MELNPLGHITLFDTAGINDTSILGSARIEKTQRAFDSSDVALLMCEQGKFDKFEKDIVEEADKRKTPCIIVISKTDLHPVSERFFEKLKKYSKHILLFSSVIVSRDKFLNALKKILVEVLPDNHIENYLSLRNIVKKGDVVVLIMSIDLGAPLGKIIMPQIQTVRHILDLNAASHIVQDTESKQRCKT